MAGFAFLMPFIAALLFATSASAQNCSCMGLDYTDGGSYLIDGSSQLPFTFHSMFEGCPDGFMTPILLDPNGNEYTCQDIESQPDDSQQASQCNLTYSQMQTGPYTIILQSTDFDFASQRQFQITVGNQGVVVVTVTPTEYVGVTVTPTAITETNEIVETQTVVGDPDTITSYCAVATQTVFDYIPGPTSIIATVIQRWITGGVITNYYQTTVEVDAYCHWPSTWVSPTSDRPPPPTPHPTKCDGCRPWYTSGSWTYTRPTSTPSRSHTRPTQTPTHTTPNRPPPMSSHHDNPPPTSSHHDQPPPSSTHHDQSPPSSTHHDTPPPSSTHHDMPPPSSTHHDTPPPSSTHHDDPPSSSTNRDSPPPSSTHHDTPPPSSTHHDNPPPSSTHHDEPPPSSTHHDTPPPSSTHHDSPPPSSTHHDTLPPSSTHHDNPPPSSTHREDPPPTTRPRETSQPPHSNPTTRQPDPPHTEPLHSNPTTRPQEPPHPNPTTRPQEPSHSEPPHSNPPPGNSNPPGHGNTGGGGGGHGKPDDLGGVDGVSQETGLARRTLLELQDVTSTVVETTYTATSTVTSTAPTPTSTEDDFYTVTTTFVPPAQTVCNDDGVPTVTYYYQGPTQTQYQVQYQTYNTWATVWVGQTQYETYTDRDAMTQCWQGGGRYGV